MFVVNEDDQRLAREFIDFIPKSIMDIHMHIYKMSDLNLPNTSALNEGPKEAGIEQVREYYTRMLPSAKLEGGLAIGFPTATYDKDAVNSFVAKQVKDNPSSKGSICIDPVDEKAACILVDENPQIIGLKPYHLFAKRDFTWNASIDEYLPEWAWKLADKRGMVITLHMVKDDAIADPDNQKIIRTMCGKYPNAQLVLAHAARCFHAPNAKKGLSSLKGLDNVWFDSSAICEAEPLMEILFEFGAKKLMWGSDYPVCTTRGRAVTLGLDFICLEPDTVAWDRLNTKCRPVVAGLESVRALQTACRYAKLSKAEIDDIFYGNAKRLLKI